MDKKTEALKLALEALEDISSHYMSLPKIGCMALAAIEEALAEQETVLPGGGHVPAVPVAVYGYCPECGGAGVMRERRPNGDDKCTNGHKYPSSKALAEQPAQQESKLPEFYARFEDGLVSVYQRREDATPLLLLRENLPGKQPAQQTCLVANEPCKHGSWCSEVYCQEHCKFVEQPAQPKGCQCPACKIAPHASDCPVHNEPAWPNGPCDCGAQPEQEPVATYHGSNDFGHEVVELEKAIPIGAKLYTSPPHRKPLTDEEIKVGWRTLPIQAPMSWSAYLAGARMAEAAHGIKE